MIFEDAMNNVYPELSFDIDGAAVNMNSPDKFGYYKNHYNLN